MDRLKAMEAFVRVVERGSFTRAAWDLGLSHGMASAMVKALEQRLGVTLLRRTTRRLALTEEGEIYFATAKRLLGELAELDAGVGGRAREVEGELRVQVPVAFAHRLLAPALGDLRRRHPRLTLNVVSSNRFPDFLAHRLDAAIFVGEVPDSGLVAHRLGRFPLVTVAAPAYLASRVAPLSVEDLAGHDCINVLSETTNRRLDWRFHRGGRDIFVDVPGVLGFEASDPAVAAALAGAGVLQIISYLAASHIRSGELVRLLEPLQYAGPDMWLLYPVPTLAPARLRAFAQFARALVRDQLAD